MHVNSGGWMSRRRTEEGSSHIKSCAIAELILMRFLLELINIPDIIFIYVFSRTGKHAGFLLEYMNCLRSMEIEE